MRLAKLQTSAGELRVGVVEDDRVSILPAELGSLGQILAHADPAGLVDDARKSATGVALADVTLLAPIDRQEVWAAGVTYKRSQKARMDESQDAATFYDKVYSADRPELFFKATPHRVVGPNQPIRIRTDTRWSVPEPELTLAISPDLRLVGFTIGNDMSARDIEGENPLYLPQAKVYSQCAGLGPVVTLASAMPELANIGIRLSIKRQGAEAFRGETSAASLHRKLDELIGWLGKDNSFPDGVFLMTGTGIVPDDSFTLEAGDVIAISIDGIGTLENSVVRG